MKPHDIPQAWKDKIAENPNSIFAKQALAAQLRLQDNPTAIPATRIKSNVGTILITLFSDRVGAVPCSSCKQTMASLNRLTPAEIRQQHDEYVVEIERNAKRAAVSWWAKILVQADALGTGGAVTRQLISNWLHEACDMAERENAY